MLVAIYSASLCSLSSIEKNISTYRIIYYYLGNTVELAIKDPLNYGQLLIILNFEYKLIYKIRQPLYKGQ